MELYNNISEEMIASFLEGTANTIDSIQVMDAIANDESIANLVSESNMIDNIDAFALHDGDYGYYELGIDPVFTREELFEFQESEIPTDISISDDIYLSDEELLSAACIEDVVITEDLEHQTSILSDDTTPNFQECGNVDMTSGSEIIEDNYEY